MQLAEYNAYLNYDSFLLSIAIIICIILSITTCLLLWLKDTSNIIKYTAVYFFSISIVYQSSSLLAFYSLPSQFELFITIKVASAMLLKTSILVLMAVYINNKKLIYLFLGIHLISFMFAIPLFTSVPFRDMIFTLSPPHTAIYGDGARIYTVLSNILFIFAGIAFYYSNKIFRQKSRYLIFLLVFILLNIWTLSLATYSTKNFLYEKMHLYLLLILLAFLFKSTPFFEKKDWILSSANIMHGIGETVIILDQHSKLLYYHNGFDVSNLSTIIDSTVEEIDKHVVKNRQLNINLNNNPLEDSEGEIRLDLDKTIYLHYKRALLYNRDTYIGKIIVLRDITRYTEIFQKLKEKNILLKEALIKQNNHIRVIRRLGSEEERGKVLSMVNRIAGKYLNELKLQILQIKTETETGSILKDQIKQENEEMLSITRRTIYDIREGIKRLYLQGE